MFTFLTWPIWGHLATSQVLPYILESRRDDQIWIHYCIFGTPPIVIYWIQVLT